MVIVILLRLRTRNVLLENRFKNSGNCDFSVSFETRIWKEFR